MQQGKTSGQKNGKNAFKLFHQVNLDTLCSGKAETRDTQNGCNTPSLDRKTVFAHRGGKKSTSKGLRGTQI